MFVVNKRKIPKGCEECASENEWDCHHVEPDGTEYVCPWRENAWKYTELQRFILLVKAQNGGFDVNRIHELTLLDFVKLGILKEYTQWQ